MTDALTIPADLKPADGRFGAGPSKIQTGHLDALAATGSALMGTSHRQAPVREVVGRVRDGLAALLLDAGRLRGGAGQRRRDGVLGRRDVRADPREEPAPVVRGVLVEVRRGRDGRAVARRPVGDQGRPRLPPGRGRRGRRRRLRLGAQRDLDRGDGAGRAPGRYDGRGGPGPGRRHLRCRRPAGGPQRGRHLLLRPAEVLRLRRRPLDRDHVAGGGRAGRARSRRRAASSPRSSTSTPRSPSRGSTRPTTPRRWPPCS